MSWAAAVAAVGTLCRFILLNSPSYLLRDASIARLTMYMSEEMLEYQSYLPEPNSNSVEAEIE